MSAEISEGVEEAESTVVEWAGTATRIEVASAQSPEGTGTAWVGASVGEARVARAEAVTVGSATRMRVAKEFAGTKGL